MNKSILKTRNELQRITTKINQLKHKYSCQNVPDIPVEMFNRTTPHQFKYQQSYNQSFDQAYRKEFRIFRNQIYQHIDEQLSRITVRQNQIQQSMDQYIKVNQFHQRQKLSKTQFLKIQHQIKNITQLVKNLTFQLKNSEIDHQKISNKNSNTIKEVEKQFQSKLKNSLESFLTKVDLKIKKQEIIAQNNRKKQQKDSEQAIQRLIKTYLSSNDDEIINIKHQINNIKNQINQINTLSKQSSLQIKNTLNKIELEKDSTHSQLKQLIKNQKIQHENHKKTQMIIEEFKTNLKNIQIQIKQISECFDKVEQKISNQQKQKSQLKQLFNQQCEELSLFKDKNTIQSNKIEHLSNLIQKIEDQMMKKQFFEQKLQNLEQQIKNSKNIMIEMIKKQKDFLNEIQVKILIDLQFNKLKDKHQSICQGINQRFIQTNKFIETKISQLKQFEEEELRKTSLETEHQNQQQNINLLNLQEKVEKLELSFRGIESEIVKKSQYQKQFNSWLQKQNQIFQYVKQLQSIIQIEKKINQQANKEIKLYLESQFNKHQILEIIKEQFIKYQTSYQNQQSNLNAVVNKFKDQILSQNTELREKLENKMDIKDNLKTEQNLNSLKQQISLKIKDSILNDIYFNVSNQFTKISSILEKTFEELQEKHNKMQINTSYFNRRIQELESSQYNNMLQIQQLKDKLTESNVESKLLPSSNILNSLSANAFIYNSRISRVSSEHIEDQ